MNDNGTLPSICADLVPTAFQVNVCPQRPGFEAIDQRGRVRGRYRFAHLAVLETTEKGWELRMEGCEA